MGRLLDVRRLVGGALLIAAIVGAALFAFTPNKAFGVPTPYAPDVLADHPSYYYRLGETSGTVAHDSSGNGHDATFASGYQLNTPSALSGDTGDASVGINNGLISANTGTEADLPSGNAPRTIEGWFKSSNNFVQTVAVWGDPNFEKSFGLLFDRNRLIATSWADDVSVNSPRFLDDNRWHQAALTYDGTAVSFYLDGQFLGTKTFQNPLTTTATNLHIGEHFGSPIFGNIDDVSVYPTALSAAAISTHFDASGNTRPAAPSNVTASASGSNAVTVHWNSTSATVPAGQSPVDNYIVTAIKAGVRGESIATASDQTSAVLHGLSGGSSYTFEVRASNTFGLSAPTVSSAATPSGNATTYATSVLSESPSQYFRLGEQNGTTYADSSGNDNLVDSSQGNWVISHNRPSPLNDGDSAISQGQANCCTGPSIPERPSGAATLPTGNSARTLEAWFKTSAGNAQTIAGWGQPGTDQSFNLNIDHTRIIAAAWADDISVKSPRFLDDNRWHHVAISYDGTAVTFYLDGQSLGTKSFNATLNTAAGALQIGQMSGGQFQGDLDEIAVYPTALSSTSIANHFNLSGNARPTAPSGITVANAGNNAVTVTWSPSAATVPTGQAQVDSYIVTSINAGVRGESIATTGDTATATLHGLSSGNVYTFEVKALNGFGESATGTSSPITPTGSTTTYASTILGDHPSQYYRLSEQNGLTYADSSGNGALVDGFPGNWVIANNRPPATVNDNDSAITQGQPGCCTGPTMQGRPTGTNLPTGNSARTVEGWFKTGAGNVQTIAGWGNTDYEQAFALSVDHSRIIAGTWADDVSVNAPRFLDDNRWHYAAVTYDGTTASFFLDGQPIGTRTFRGTLNTGQSALQLAGFSGGQFNGDLDEVAVYPGALTPTAIANHFTASGNTRPTAPSSVTVANAGDNSVTVSWASPTATVPTGQLPVDTYTVTAINGSARAQAVATDSGHTSVTLHGLSGGASYTFEVKAFNGFGESATGTSSVITPTGTASTYATTVLGDHPSQYFRVSEQNGLTYADSSGNANLVDGFPGNWSITDNHASALVSDGDSAINQGQPGCCTGPTMQGRPGGTNLPTGNSARTVEGWFKTSAGNTQTIAGWGTTDFEQSFALSIDHTRVIAGTWGDDVSVNAPRFLDDNRWHHAAVTYDGTTASFYLDGQPLGTRTFRGALNTGVSALQLAGYSGGQFNGDLDEVAVYPTALTSSSIANHFAASGDTRPTMPTGVTATPSGDNAVTVQWTSSTSAMPASEPQVDTYVVTAIKSGVRSEAIATTGAQSSATIHGLSGGSAYTFEVKPLNSLGTGTVATSASVTPSGNATTYAATVLGDSPSQYYRLGEQNGLTYADSSGNDNLVDGFPGNWTITDNHPPAIVNDTDTALEQGQPGCCTGPTMQGRPAGTNLPTGNSARTVEGWFKTGAGNIQTIAGWGNTDYEQSFALSVDRTRIIASTWGDDVSVNSPRFLNDNRWHHAAVTYDGTTATFYLDGQSLGTKTFRGALNTGVSALQLAGYSGGQFNGDLDEVAVYPTSLSSSKIAGHFDSSGNSRPTTPASVLATTSGNNSVTITWAASTAIVPAGQSAVDTYVVTSVANGVRGIAVATAGDQHTATLRGLSGGKNYTFEVVAMNGFGASASGVSPTVIPTGDSTTYASSILAADPDVYLRMSETSGNTYAESSTHSGLAYGFPNNGQLVGGQTSAIASDTDPATRIGPNGCCTAAVINGSPNLTSLPSGNVGRSVELWFKTTQEGTTTPLQWGTDGHNFGISIDKNHVGVLANNQNTMIPAGRSINDNNWHHVVAVTDGTTVQLYLDDKLEGTSTFGFALNTDPSALSIGNGFDGQLDEVAIYDHPFTSREVATHTRTGRAPQSVVGRSEGAQS